MAFHTLVIYLAYALFRWAVIHNSDEFPDFVRNGIRIAAGTQALVGLSKVRIGDLPGWIVSSNI